MDEAIMPTDPLKKEAIEEIKRRVSITVVFSE